GRERSAEPREHLLGRISVRDTADRAQQVEDRDVRDRATVRQAAALESRDPALAERTGELEDEARLAGAGLPDHRCRMAATRLHLGQQIGQRAQLTLAAHEETRAATGRRRAD